MSHESYRINGEKPYEKINKYLKKDAKTGLLTEFPLMVKVPILVINSYRVIDEEQEMVYHPDSFKLKHLFKLKDGNKMIDILIDYKLIENCLISTLSFHC